MLTPYTERQKTMIVNNIIKAIDAPYKLSKQAYKYLYLCSGFIAHYNHQGFMVYYCRQGKLKEDILNFAQCNQWRNFTAADKDYQYYQSKADIYNRIVQSIKGA
jgi:hypothetical protein